MITFAGLILPKQKKKDNTWNVKIRVTYKRSIRYLSTSIYVTKGQLNTKQTKITDIQLNKKIESKIEEYRRIVDDIEISPTLNVNDVIRFIQKHIENQAKKEIDFIAFSKQTIEQLELKQKTKTANEYKTAINNLQDFFGNKKVLITDITGKTMRQFEEYLKTERTITRLNQFGRPVTTKRPPIGNGLHNYMKVIRTLFNKAIAEHNDEDVNEQVITHYPFKKYKVPKPVAPENKGLPIEVIRQIRDYQPGENDKRALLARDVFMLSFYLVGINLKDIYYADTIKKGRLTYNRSKTADRRSDKAFISINIEPEVLPLIDKYADASKKRIFNFYNRYSTHTELNKAVNIGLSQICKKLHLEEAVTFGVARPSWATIAFNDCGVSKDEVDIALNHVDPRHKLANVYIKKDFSSIDRSNRKVLDTLR